MEKIADRLKLSNKLIWKEISNRTNCPADVARIVVEAYAEIVSECVKSGVECKFGKLGTFSFVDMPPKEDVETYNPWTKKHNAHAYIPGYKRFTFRISPTWKKQLRIDTAYAPWEENGNENGKENENG